MNHAWKQTNETGNDITGKGLYYIYYMQLIETVFFCHLIYFNK